MSSLEGGKRLQTPKSAGVWSLSEPHHGVPPVVALKGGGGVRAKKHNNISSEFLNRLFPPEQVKQLRKSMSLVPDRKALKALSIALTRKKRKSTIMSTEQYETDSYRVPVRLLWLQYFCQLLHY